MGLWCAGLGQWGASDEVAEEVEQIVAIKGEVHKSGNISLSLFFPPAFF